jgi:hypothetical protein
MPTLWITPLMLKRLAAAGLAERSERPDDDDSLTYNNHGDEITPTKE